MTRRAIVVIALLASCALTMGAGWLSGPRFGAGIGPGFAPMVRWTTSAEASPPYQQSDILVDARMWEYSDPGFGAGSATLVEHGLSTTDYYQNTETAKPLATTSPTLGACVYFDGGDWLASADNDSNDASGAYTIAFYGIFPNGADIGCVVSNSVDRTASTKASYNLFADQANNRLLCTTGNSAYNTKSINTISRTVPTVIGMTRTGTATWKYFVDTTDVTSGSSWTNTPTPPEPCAYPVNIGRQSSITAFAFTGWIRRVIVWKTDLRSHSGMGELPRL